MTAKTIEKLIIAHTKVIATLDESLKNLREKFFGVEKDRTYSSRNVGDIE